MVVVTLNKYEQPLEQNIHVKIVKLQVGVALNHLPRDQQDFFVGSSAKTQLNLHRI